LNPPLSAAEAQDREQRLAWPLYPAMFHSSSLGNELPEMVVQTADFDYWPVYVTSNLNLRYSKLGKCREDWQFVLLTVLHTQGMNILKMDSSLTILFSISL
jgi:hypothetical protein